MKETIKKIRNEIIEKIEAMRDNGEIQEEIANNNLIPMIEEITEKAIEE